MKTQQLLIPGDISEAVGYINYHAREPIVYQGITFIYTKSHPKYPIDYYWSKDNPQYWIEKFTRYEATYLMTQDYLREILTQKP